MTILRKYVLRNDAIVESAREFIGELPRDPLCEVVIQRYKAKRSIAQNSLLHFWMRYISDWYYHTHGKLIAPEVWKIYFKRHFLGQEHHEMFGESWDETRHTDDLSVQEMGEFLNNINHYCGAELGVLLPLPKDIWDEAMGRAV